MKNSILSIIVLAAAISFPAQAQLGGALKKAADAAKKVENVTEKSSNVQGTIQESVPDEVSAVATAAVRKAKPVWLLAKDEHREDFRGTFATDIRKYSSDSIKVIKEMVEARHAENLTIMDEIAKEEIENYDGLMQQCRWATTTYADIKMDGNKVVGTIIDCGLHVAGYGENTEGKLAFLVDGGPNKPGIVDPLPDNEYQEELARYENLALMMRQEPPAEQYPERQTAQLARSLIVQAQKNAFELQKKLPMPDDGMKDPALAAQMLKLAQAKFPNMGIVKVVIRDNDWTVERDAVGNILRKRIGTFVIKKNGDNYRMTDHSFAQPYEGGKYGATIHYAVGLQNLPVEYKE